MTYLDIHRNSFRFQIAVPADLQYLIGRSPLRMPIGRIPALAARRLARVLSRHAEKLFTAVRTGNFDAVTKHDLRDEMIKELTEMVETLLHQIQEIRATAEKRIEVAVQTTELTLLTEHFRQQKEFSTKLQALGGGIDDVKKQASTLHNISGTHKFADAISNRLSEALAIVTTMLSPKRLTVFTRPRSSIGEDHGAISKPWSLPRSNGSTGSTTAAFSSPSETSLQPWPSNATTPC